MKKVWAIATAWIVALWSVAVSQASKLQDLRIELNTLTWSVEKWKKLFSDIQKEASKTPFESDDLVRSTSTMLQFWVAQKDVMQNLKMLWDIAGWNASKLQSLALVFWQVNSAWKLTWWDLLQLVNAWFNPLKSMSDRTGESMSSLRDKMRDWQISFKMIQEEMRLATSEWWLFFWMMDKKSQTFSWVMSTLKDNVWITLASLWWFSDGEVVQWWLLDQLTQAMTTFMPYLENIQQRASKNPEMARNILLTTWAIAWLITVIWTLWLVLPAITTWLNSIKLAILWLWKAMVRLFTNPIWLTILAIWWLIAIWVSLYKNRDKIRASGTQARWSIKTSVKSAIDYVIVQLNKAIIYVNQFLSKIWLAIPQLKNFEAESKSLATSQTKVWAVIWWVLNWVADKLWSITQSDLANFWNKAKWVMETMAWTTKQVTAETNNLSTAIWWGWWVNSKLKEQDELLKEVEKIAKEKAEVEKQAYDEIKKAWQEAYDKIGEAVLKSKDAIIWINESIKDTEEKLLELWKNTNTSVATEYIKIQENIKKNEADRIANLEKIKGLEMSSSAWWSVWGGLWAEKEKQKKLLEEQISLENQLSLAKWNTTAEDIARAEMIAKESWIEKILRESAEKEAVLQAELMTLELNKQAEIEIFRALYEQKRLFEQEYLRELDISTARQIANYNSLIEKQRQLNVVRDWNYVPSTWTQPINNTNNNVSVTMWWVNATIRESADIDKVADKLARKIQLNRQFNFN